jgi:alpha-glucosidase (family GH31 glycosyl hydrolase)
MYPEILPLVRDAIRNRYAMIPYLYSLHLESHNYALPPQRWVGWGYESDPQVWSNKKLLDGEEQYWLGDSLLVGGVYEPGATVAKIYLPKRKGENEGYYNLNDPYDYFEPGQWVEIRSEWQQSIPILAKAGEAIPFGKAEQTVAPGDTKNEADLPEDDYRYLLIFPPYGSSNGKTYESFWYEDDGLALEPNQTRYCLRMSCTHEQICLQVSSQKGKPQMPWQKNPLGLFVPVGETRLLVNNMDGSILEARPAPENSAAAASRHRGKYYVVNVELE